MRFDEDRMKQILPALEREARKAVKLAKSEEEKMYIAACAFEIGRAIAVEMLGRIGTAQWLRRIAVLMDGHADAEITVARWPARNKRRLPWK